MNNENIVLVIGAGVDKTPGLDMPLAGQLVSELARFAEEEGKDIEKTIRSFLPGLRFSFNKFIKDAIASFTKFEKKQIYGFIKELEKQKNEIDKEDEKSKKLADLLITLLKKIGNIHEGSKLDDEIVKLIKEVFGEDIIKEIEDESIIEFAKISFSDSFKVVMKRVLKQSLKEPDNPIHKILSTNFLNIENILVETFLGFYNEKPSDIKKGDSSL